MAIDLIIWLVIGAIAGWLSSQLAMAGGLGLVWDLIIGIVGAVIAGNVLATLGIYSGGGFVAAIVNALIGAIVFLVIARVCKVILQPDKA